MSHIRRDTRSTNCNQLYTPKPNYTEANSQSNTDFARHGRARAYKTGNHVATVHCLSIDSAIIKNIYLVFKNTKK